jgi:hypothetical protein
MEYLSSFPPCHHSVGGRLVRLFFDSRTLGVFEDSLVVHRGICLRVQGRQRDLQRAWKSQPLLYKYLRTLGSSPLPSLFLAVRESTMFSTGLPKVTEVLVARATKVADKNFILP